MSWGFPVSSSRLTEEPRPKILPRYENAVFATYPFSVSIRRLPKSPRSSIPLYYRLHILREGVVCTLALATIGNLPKKHRLTTYLLPWKVAGYVIGRCFVR